jgi:hypothetical protein
LVLQVGLHLIFEVVLRSLLAEEPSGSFADGVSSLLTNSELMLDSSTGAAFYSFFALLLEGLVPKGLLDCPICCISCLLVVLVF